MSYDIPDDRRYRETHEWVLQDDGTAQIGITEFAQEELGDVVFVELPEVGDAVTADESFGVVESIKAVSDLYAPVSGEVTAVNDVLFDRPELLNESPFEAGWLLEVELSDAEELAGLLDPDAYADQIA